jgi:hypothetical protein
MLQETQIPQEPQAEEVLVGVEQVGQAGLVAVETVRLGPNQVEEAVVKVEAEILEVAEVRGKLLSHGPVQIH